LETKIIDIQGHRGARGLYPENTITAFTEAVREGANTLEMDVVVSKDLRIVVSHEPWMNETFCSKPNGEPVEKNTREKYNLFKMNYAEISAFDCGRRGNPEFPLQRAIPEHKPLLSEVIEKVDLYTKENDLVPVNFNIEIKCEPGSDGIFHPDPETFVDLLFDEIKKHDSADRIYLQSFDVRILQEVKKKDPKMKLALLIENKETPEQNLKRLGFNPEIYSPDFSLVNPELVKDLHAKNIQIIPWTVNEVNDMKKLLEMEVDGIITDYPNRAVKVVMDMQSI